jgi:hypothetical protein
MDIEKDDYLKIVNLLWFFLFLLNQVINLTLYIVSYKHKYQ